MSGTLRPSLWPEPQMKIHPGYKAKKNFSGHPLSIGQGQELPSSAMTSSS